MIDGLNVLHTYEIVNPEWNDKMFPAVCFGVVALAGVALIIYIFRDKESAKQASFPTFIVILLTLFMMVFSIYGFTHLPENKYQTRYDVTIEDSVNFNEFNSKYEVVKQEGLIYTIYEKE